MGVKIAFIGAGNMAREHVKAFASIPEVKLAGIYSRTYEKAEVLAAEYGIEKTCRSIEELYSATKADFIVITVNVLDIAATVKEAAKYGWQIFTEKPAGHNLEASAELVALKKPVFVALNRRFLSSSVYAKAELSKTNSRRIVEITDQQSPQAAVKAGHPAEVVKYWMYANSIHLIDLANFYCRGNMVSVTNLKKWNGGAADFILSHIEYDSGDEALYRCYFTQPAPWSAVITTNEARFEMRPLEKLLVQNAGERVLNEIPQHPDDISYKPGFALQAKALLAGNAPTIAESHCSMQLVNKIYEV